MPDWMQEIEDKFFRTAHDIGATGSALAVWNQVRAAHGEDPITIDDLWVRHARAVKWSEEELVSERRDWEEFQDYERLTGLRDEYRRYEQAIEALPRTNQEFFANRRKAKDAGANL